MTEALLTEAPLTEAPLTEAPSIDARGNLTLELTLAPEDLPLLLRHPDCRAASRRRPVSCSVIWHDTPDGLLEQSGRALAQLNPGGAWQVTRLVPLPGEIAPPGAPAIVLAEDDGRATLEAPMREACQPVAAFDGRERRLSPPDADVTIRVLEGQLRAVTATALVCRVILSGPGCVGVAAALAGQMRLAAPATGLAAEALALAHRVTGRRPLGAPLLDEGLDVDRGFAVVVAHLAGVILHYAPHAQQDGGPEPVHQMRVALRRLRSAISLFRRAIACPELDAVTLQLKALGEVLGPPRDWDVFTGGTGRKVGLAFPEDPAVTLLLAAAERRRLAGYAALRAHLDSAAFRQIGIALAGLALERPWRHVLPEDAEEAQRVAELRHSELRAYAARALRRRFARVVAPGADLQGMALPALHDIRLQAKRLRYAAEFFSPLFPGRQTRRFLRRMGALQERLGLINDGVVAQALMAELPGRGPGRAYAAGVVRGFVAARTGGGLRKLDRTWQRFLRAEPFWD